MPSTSDDKIASYYAARATTLHVPEAVMLAYVAGNTPPETSDVISAHLERCEHCEQLRSDAEVYLKSMSGAPAEDAPRIRQIAERARKSALRQISMEGAENLPTVHFGKTLLACVKHMQAGIKQLFTVESLPAVGSYLIEYMGRLVSVDVKDVDLRPDFSSLVARGENTPISLSRSVESADGHLRVYLCATLPKKGDKPRVYLSIEYFED